MDAREFEDVVETWVIRRHDRNSFSQRDLRDFIEVMNAMTRKLISVTGRNTEADVNGFWSALAELSTHAQTMLTPGAKVYGDGIDRTNL